jgi:hypothetical protein
MNARLSASARVRRLQAVGALARTLGCVGILCGAVIGCDDPSLRVVVERPAAYAELVQRVEVTIYQRDALGCDEIAFDHLSAEELKTIERSRSDEKTLALTAIPRLGRKAVVARGYGKIARLDPGVERLIIAGCAEVDEITDQDRVVIKTEPVATVATDSTLIAPGRGAVQIDVVAVDALQKGIDAKEVRWTTYGAAGAFPASGDIDEPSTPLVLRTGEGSIRPNPPATVGPYAVQVRVKWSTGLPPVVSGMMLTPPLSRSLGLADPSFINTCTIYARGGVPALACLEKDSPALRFVRSYRIVGDLLAQVAAPVSVPNAIGVFGVGNGAVVVNADGTYAGLFGAPFSGSVCPAGCAGLTVVDVLAFTGCTGTAPVLFAHYREGTVPRLLATVLATSQKIPFTAPAEALLSPLSLDAIGCVTDLERSTQPQTAVMVSTNASRSIYGLGSMIAIERARDRRQAGTGFTFSGQEARVLTTELDPTGFVVVESVLSKPGLVYRLFERRRSPAVAPPRHYVSGTFDYDDATDLAWDVLDDLDNQKRAIQVLLAARPGRPPLSGAVSIADATDLLAADLDGDGIQEVIGVSNNSFTVQRVGGVH